MFGIENHLHHIVDLVSLVLCTLNGIPFNVVVLLSFYPNFWLFFNASGDRERLDVGNRQLRQYPIDGAGYDISVFPPTDQCHCQCESHTTEIDTKPPAEQTVSMEHEPRENSATQVLSPNQDMNNTAMTMSHQTNSGVATPSPQHTNVPAEEPTGE